MGEMLFGASMYNLMIPYTCVVCTVFVLSVYEAGFCLWFSIFTAYVLIKRISSFDCVWHAFSLVRSALMVCTGEDIITETDYS